MRKLLAVALITITLFSCKKEQAAPAPTPAVDCNCGVVTQIYLDTNPPAKFRKFMRNDCSNNNSEVIIPSTFFSVKVGDKLCIGYSW